jgi:hypothetical protein
MMGCGRSATTYTLLSTVHDILETIQPCSVRAVCYQLLNRHLIPSVTKTETNRISALLTWAREEDEILFGWIVQEGNAIEQVATWDDPAAYARAVQASYRHNKWAGQAHDVIVVSEKGRCAGRCPGARRLRGRLLSRSDGMAARPASMNSRHARVPRGRSWSSTWVITTRAGSMSEVDLPRRLAFHAHRERAGVTRAESREWADDTVGLYLEHGGLVSRQLVLTAVDTQTLGPRLSFPASDKEPQANSPGDARYHWFVQHHGRRCWELDAMNPNDLRARVEAAIVAEIEPVAWGRYVRAEAAERESIETTLSTWNRIPGLAPE